MNMKKLLTVVLLIATGSVFAQDIHFSQFYNSPLTLNPALTGKVNGTFRVGAIYRNQWFGPVNGKTTFSTPSVSVDMPIRFKKDVLGVGAYFVGDRSSEGRLKNNLFVASIAYHKALGKDNNHSLSLGVQGGYGQKQLDAANIRWASQFDNQQTFDPNRAGEALANNSKGALQLNAGLLYSGKFSDKFKMYLGGSAFHLNSPEQNFADGSVDGTPIRIVGHGGLDIGVTEKISLLPSIIYMSQATASELNAGLSLAFNLNAESTLYVGGYYRVKDAIIPYVGFDVKGFRLGISYDVNASALNNTNGTIEASLQYIGKYIPVPNINPALYCPRF
jgi:type IX secretion system PorP/SprF family membrane protein